MAKVTNTFVSTDAVGNREELSDVVSRITPEDTPIYSLIGSGSCKTTHPEWEKEELAAPGDNAQPEGNEYSFDAISPAERMGNYTQIYSKPWIVSNTQNAADNAGDAEKGLKKQKLKKGIELRKDVELNLVGANASVAGETRRSGSLSTWYETNVSRGSGGANGGFDSATGLTVAPTDGTRRAFTKALLDDTMQQAYQSGANVRDLVVSPYVKSVFVSFMSDSNVAAFRYAAHSGKKNTLVATADVYEGPFGKVMIHPNRVMSTAATSRNVHLLDREMLSYNWFRKIKEDKDVAKTGDAQKKVLIGEGTLKVKNEAGLGVIADVFGLTATT
jgi:hypothetical protein